MEYTNLFSLERDSRIALLERMPVLESAMREESAKGTGAPVIAGTLALHCIHMFPTTFEIFILHKHRSILAYSNEPTH